MSVQRHKQYKDERIERAIKELDGYKAIVARIRGLKEQRIRLEENYSGIKAVDYAKLRVQGGAIKDVLVDTAIKWADLCAEIAHAEVECEHKRFEIEGKIQMLDYSEQQVIALYYINRLSNDEIARIMKMSYDGFAKLKRRALRHYADIGVAK